MRIALILLMTIHALIHLIGFVKTAGAGPASTFPGAPTVFAVQVVRALWLATCAVLLMAAGLIALRQPHWWVIAGFALIASQALVTNQWSEAWAGTLANVLLGCIVVAAWADARFTREGDLLIRHMLDRGAEASASVVTTEDLRPLPEPVQRWLEASSVVGKPRVRSLRLQQRGGMRTAPEQDFMPATAEQYFSVDPPAFIWRVRDPMFHVLPVAGRDAYLEGEGRMTIKAASLVPIVDAQGEPIDQGAMLRFLGEMVWFPSAALSSYVEWQSIDDQRARATMRYGGVEAAAEFTFDSTGRMISMQAQRYMGGGKEARLLPWKVQASAWQRFHGIQVPVKGTVQWQLPEGVFTYYKWEISNIDYDVPELYGVE